MQSKPGTYVLVMRSRRRVTAQIGRWGRLDVRPGYYLYVGSAFGPGGVAARVSRHCREAKSKRWQVDYLREHAAMAAVWCSHDTVRLEHHWAQALAEMPGSLPVPGFGCSDCHCEAHLFFSQRPPDFQAFAGAVAGHVQRCACESVG